MDNGEEIPALNEDWTFLGAKMIEWAAGLITFFIAADVLFKGKLGTGMPLLLLISIGTTMGLAGVRKKFPDEEKGVMNLFLCTLGFKPPKLPNPASLQYFWSGAPMRTLDPNKEFIELGLDKLFEIKEKENDIL